MKTPPMNCQINFKIAIRGDSNALVAICINVIVRRIAIGSFAADSTFNVVANLVLIGFDLFIINTAAASVEEMIDDIISE